MRRFFTKVIFSLLISLCIISTFSMYTPVSAVVDTYEDNVFSFKGTCNIAHHCTGMFMDVTVKATASNNNNETITLKIYQ